MKKTIAVLSGDGIGPEVTTEAVKVLETIGDKLPWPLHFVYGSIGGEAIDRYGNPLPEETLSIIKKSDAVLLGAVGGPKWDTLPSEKRPEFGLLKLRQALGVFANLRPITIYPPLITYSPVKEEILKDVNLMIVRELTSGIYFGQHQTDNHKAKDVSWYTEEEIIRVAKIAFQIAQTRKKHITSIDKANVLDTSKLWRKIVIEISKNFPDVLLDHLYVDNAAMQLIKNPSHFDVILTENMFGDILSDEAAVLSASIGLLPSASIGDVHPFLYEPIHGSAPKYAGQNKVNPIGTILSAALLLRYSFDLENEARAIEDAVEKALTDGARTYDIAGSKEKIVTTSQMGDIIAKNL